MPKSVVGEVVLEFGKFWEWLQGHPNCIVSVATPEAVLYDHDDFHWHLGKEGQDTLLVQVLRGKDLVGEVLIASGTVTYVEIEEKGPEEFVFDCIVEADDGPYAAYSFTLSHGYDPGEQPETPGRWVH